MAQGWDVRFDDGEEVSRDYLAEWVRQLCGTAITLDVDSLTISELTRLVLLFVNSDELAEACA